MSRDTTQAVASPAWACDRGGHLWPKDRETVAPDGARIRYTVRGQDGPWLVLAAGFLCPDNFWRYLVPHFERDHRVLVLNYRGVGASTDPREPGFRARNVRADDYTVERFAGDVGAVIEAEDARDVTLVGHSMGCQVALETWRQQEERAEERGGANRIGALVLVTGPYASPMHTFYGSKLGLYLFPLAYAGIPLMPRVVQRAIGRSLRLPVVIPVARWIQALGPRTPAEAMQGFFEHFGSVDPMIILKIAKGMHDFDAGPWLSDVAVPSLVVVGSQDRFSPPELGELMVDVLPDAELVEIEGGTHAALIEFPDAVHAAIEAFLERVAGQ